MVSMNQPPPVMVKSSATRLPAADLVAGAVGAQAECCLQGAGVGATGAAARMGDQRAVVVQHGLRSEPGAHGDATAGRTSPLRSDGSTAPERLSIAARA